MAGERPMRAPDFWDGEPGFIAGLQTPVGAAVDAAGRLRRAVARPYRAPVPVICVGNLVAGGSGKTPVALSLAARLAARGIATAIVMRGYGGWLAGPVRVDPARHDAAAVGDEALLAAARARAGWRATAPRVYAPRSKRAPERSSSTTDFRTRMSRRICR